MTELKIKVAIIAGGKSAEHEVSLVSAKNILSAIDKSKYEPVLIGLSKKGEWFFCPDWNWLPQMPGLYKDTVEENGIPLAITPGEPKGQFKIRECKECSNINNSGDESSQSKFIKLDAAFPIMHGPLGEDGALQGMLKLLEIPFVGPDVLGSAVCMDKIAMKKVLGQTGIPTAKFMEFDNHNKSSINLQQLSETLNFPMYVKPANMGSSVGISKAKTADDLQKAIDLAFKYDNKILIEQEIRGREVECAILGNEEPKASSIGEIKGCNDNFYSYDAKYINENEAQLLIPADLTENEKKSLQDMAIKAYKATFCRGMARVDMFLTPEGNIFVNELNTLPGFTKISMYPGLWQDAGLKYGDLIDQLIVFAIQAGA